MTMNRRQAFEAWLDSQGSLFPPPQMEGGFYKDPATQYAWWGFQAGSPIITDKMIQTGTRAMQYAWNDFVEDTNCHPDCFRIHKGQLHADFANSTFGAQLVEAVLQSVFSKKE